METKLDGWQGEGWYTFRTWIHTNGDYEVEDFDSPERPEAYWVESEYDFNEFITDDPERETLVDYYGCGEYPDAPVSVAEYPDFDYMEWRRIQEEMM